MTTEKPKVSAYVPQHIKNQLQDFCKLGDLSESSAITFILAEYFGCEVDAPSALATGDVLRKIDETFSRLVELESKVASSSALEVEVAERIARLEQKLEGLQESEGSFRPQKDPLDDIFDRHYGNGKSRSTKEPCR
jgi:hypothetical protein